MSAVPKPFVVGENPNEGQWHYPAGAYLVQTTANPPVTVGTLNIATKTVGNNTMLDVQNSNFVLPTQTVLSLQTLNSNGNSGVGFGNGNAGTVHFKYQDSNIPPQEHDYKMTCTTNVSTQTVFTEDPSPRETPGGYTATYTPSSKR
jgi:hypothetical protein